ncbi:MAG: flagellar motor switch protein FliN, partial [Clostridiales bacterium]|nr:flagellar motor switch protein FliN [Clostridiales bacterium]
YDLINDIPLQVTVELGKAKKSLSEVLNFGIGSIIVLDKLAGELVDVIVNGKRIAKGEVVVIDDNYGVRITELIR